MSFTGHLTTTTYQSNKNRLTVFDVSTQEKDSPSKANLFKSKTIQTSKVTIVIALKGKLSFESKEYKQDCIVGESLIIPPQKAMKLTIFSSQKTKNNSPNKKELVSWLELQVPIESINITISQYNKTNQDYNFKLESNAAWQFGEQPINVTHDTGIRQAIDRITYLFTEEHYNKEAFIDFAIKELILRYWRTPTRDKLDFEKIEEEPSETNPSIEAVLEYIKENIHEPISIDTLTDIASMSKAAFFRTFKETLDISPIDYINRERVEIAKNRLVDISKSVTDICYELGYNHMTYFIRVFKKYEGITPKQFQIRQSKKKEEEDTSTEE